MAKAYKAKWILTSADENSDYQKVYEDSALIVEDGIITNILPQSEIYDEVYESVEDFKNSVITPGFVNLNANLLYKNLSKDKKFFVKLKQFFSMLGTPLDNYAMKLADIKAEFISLNKKQKIEIFKDNLKNEIVSGTTCLLQTIKTDKNDKKFFEILNKLPLKTFLMFEIIADSDKKSNINFKKLKNTYKLFKKGKNDSTYFGLNPKSIWQVNKRMWRVLGKFARLNKLIMISEILESQEEYEWVNEGFSYLNYYNEFIGNKKITYEKGFSPVEYLRNLKVLGENLIIQNGNFLNSGELKTLAEYEVNMAFSPSLNKDFFNKELSCEIILRYFSKHFGFMANVKEKTVLEELFNMNLPLSIEEQIKYITLYPAKILGINDIIGSLEYNKHADFNVFKLDKKQKLLTDLRYNLKPDAVFILGNLIAKDGEFDKI